MTENRQTADALRDDYAPILDYARTHSGIPYANFDADVIRRVDLFALRENFDFDALETALDRISRALPSIRRIFDSPIIRLRDADEILPAETVRVINNRTLVHTSSHSELWADLTADGLKPRKLLTVASEDDYSIYENQVFVRVVNAIHGLAERSIRVLRQMVEGSRRLEFNLLDRSEHLEYYLALGKLHVGYVRDFEDTRRRAERLLARLTHVDRLIRAGMKRPVCQKCRALKGPLKLQRTNIFRHHKDYHRIYLLAAYFDELQIDELPRVFPGSGEGYGVFCNLLTLFAAGHFGFEFPPDRKIDFFRPHVAARFRDWTLNLDGEEEGLRITLSKERNYTLLLIPSVGRDDRNDRDGGDRNAGARIPAGIADECLLADPAQDGEGRLYLSLFDLDSFRRIQRLLLKGMLYADSARTVCPFCGGELSAPDPAENTDQARTCAFCGTVYLTLRCPNRGREFPATRALSPDQKRSRLLQITPTDGEGNPLCPFCGGDHRTAPTVPLTPPAGVEILSDEVEIRRIPAENAQNPG